MVKKMTRYRITYNKFADHYPYRVEWRNDPINNHLYLGTVLTNNDSLVWHVFEIKDE